jgi:4-amino-4-deoxy-L-arabinose transferase-like glycosyltransferase
MNISANAFWTRRRAVLFLLGLSLFFFFFRLGALDVTSTDEARRSLVIRAMVASGHYAIPTFEGEAYLKKPPLFYWLGALAQITSGSRDAWVYRFPSAVAGLLTVLVFFVLASRLLSLRAALLAATVLATSVMIVVHATRAQIDMTLGCFVTASMLFLARAREQGWSGAPWWGFWIACGLAMLTKGPVGLLFPIGAAIFLAAGPGFSGELGRMRPLAGLAVAAAVFLPWGALVLREIGLQPAARLLYQEVFQGYADPARSHVEPLLFYFWETPSHFLPWAVFLPAAIAALREPRSNAERDMLRLAAAWFLPALVVLSLTHQKRSYYLLPGYGALALWHGWALDRFLLSPKAADERGPARRLAWIALGALGAAAAAGALLGGVWLRAKQPHLFASAAPSVVALALWGTYLFLSLRRGRPGRAVAALVVAAMLAVGAWRGPLAPWLNARSSMRVFAEAIARATPPDATLLAFLHDQPTLEYYVGRRIVPEDSEDRLRRRLASPEPIYVVLEEKDFEARRALFRRRVLRHESPMHQGRTLVLATNQVELLRPSLREGPRDKGP